MGRFRQDSGLRGFKYPHMDKNDATEFDYLKGHVQTDKISQI